MFLEKLSHEVNFEFFLDIPKLRKTTSDIELIAGDSFSALCSVASGSKPLKFEWCKNNLPLQKEIFKIQSIDEWNSLLKSASVDTSDIGNYTCRVSNAFGSDSATTMLKIKSKIR